MKLVTFQSMDALKYLIKNGELICDDKYIDKKKSGVIYNWVLEKMNNKIKKIQKQHILYGVWLSVTIVFVLQSIREKGLMALM